MKYLLAYGSLIHPEEIIDAKLDIETAIPISVRGFRREFSQEPTWRTGDGVRRAVLTVVRSPEGWFNGIVLQDVTAAQLALFDQREAGYNRVAISTNEIVTHDHGLPLDLKLNVYVGKPEKRNPGISPNRDYLELCLQGAQRWGECFYRDFLVTTFADGRPLKEFLMRDNADAF